MSEVTVTHRLRIKQLDSLLSNQIAAGEVIERPASIVKECIENSLDAKANSITVCIEHGGLTSIKITDDGVGIDKHDLLLAFSKHATSKIAEPEDLFAIKSLGFRGEALASIASVAQVNLISRTAYQDLAWEIQVTPEYDAIIKPSAHEIGTTIEIKELFYNVPVRRKFLKSFNTEYQYIDEMLKKLSLSNPAVRFTLIHNAKVIRNYHANYITQLPATDLAASVIAQRVIQVCGKHFYEHAELIEYQATKLQILGWLGRPEFARRQTDCQYFFINQRMVKDRIILQAIRSVYADLPGMLDGTYPCYVLYLTVDHTEVDVNVHPTKSEVRFSQPRLIYDFIVAALSSVLEVAKLSTSQSMPLITPSKNLYAEHNSDCVQNTGTCVVEPVAKLPSLSKHTVFVRTASFLFYEIAAGVRVFSIKQYYLALAECYFKRFIGNVQVKNLMFPEEIAGGAWCTDQNLSAKLTALSKLGFACEIKFNNIYLLTIPEYFEFYDLAQLVVEFLAECAAEENNQPTILKYLSSNDLLLPNEICALILEDLLKLEPNAGVYCPF